MKSAKARNGRKKLEDKKREGERLRQRINLKMIERCQLFLAKYLFIYFYLYFYILWQVLGELHVSVCHQPLSAKVSVTVIQARNLPKISSLNIGGETWANFSERAQCPTALPRLSLRVLWFASLSTERA